MKKMLIFIFCLALTSLACLQSAMVAGPVQTETAATPELVIDPTPSPSPKSTNDFGEGSKVTCAKVIAIEALNVRFGASDREKVLTWLKSGELVQVLDQSDRDWWKIERGGKSGYVRSSYLQESECE
jgi:uncharacterized protein YgiM (DUF1202 family)